jgi:exopolysaccharide biosynthesis polyprenyl glycosylphosphotransferase
MLRRERQVLVQVQRLLDALLYAFAFWLAHRLRAGGLFDFLLPRPEIQPFAAYDWMILVVLPLAPLVLTLQGFYARPLTASRRQTLWQAFWGSAWITLALVVVSFLTREQPARAVILLFGGLGFGLVVVKEELIRWWVQSKLGRAQLRRRLLLLGTAEDRQLLRRRLERETRGGVEILDELDLNETPVEQLIDRLHRLSPNGVLLSARHTYFGQVEKVIAACELEGIEVWLMADFFKTQISQTIVDDFHGLPMLVFRSTPEASWQVLAKKVIDLAGAAALLLAFSPAMLVAAVAIRLSSPGPVLFRQQRCGLNGRPFTMLKFRSMVTDAEQRRHELEQLNEMSGPVFKVTADPRVTPVGRLLRKYSVDEFPQLLNVLRGEMSLVGPRPLPVNEVARFDDLAHRRRLSVKPGITCLWQVSGRSDLRDFREWVRLDLEYIDNWSLWLDIRILLRTVPVVLAGSGAR